MSQSLNLLWLQAGSCGGCTMSMLERGASGWVQELDNFGIRLLWHPSMSEETGVDVLSILESLEQERVPLDILCVEGSILRGPNGTGLCNRLAGTGRSMFDWVRSLAPKATYCVAMGSCSSYGGIPAGEPDPTQACGLQFEGALPGGALGTGFRSRSGLPVINVAGCAPHPGWMMETLQGLALGDFGAADLDVFGRPKFYADHLAHHGCSRNEYYEFKASAEHLSELGCLMEHLGCRATQAVGDCNQRSWNGSGSCTHAGYACIACTAPDFETNRTFLQTPKLAGIPVGLPLDMPKAWFVALAALSKSATPKRVSRNANSDHIIQPPKQGKGGKE